MRRLALLACVMATPLWAQTDLRAEDAARLDRYDRIAGSALMRALSSGRKTDITILTEALSGTPQIAFDETLAGDWKCRTIKLGGAKNLTTYTPFNCRFTFEGNSYRFEKLGGSERTIGSISMREGRAIYVGVGHLAGQTPPRYQDLPPDFRPDVNLQTNVAVFERISPRRARLMFPAPAFESDFDILELTR